MDIQRIGEFEFGSKLLGHGAFALVFQGQRIKVVAQPCS